MFRIIVLATLRCFWTDRAIWVKSFVTLKLLKPLETLAKRAARSAASFSERRLEFALNDEQKLAKLKVVKCTLMHQRWVDLQIRTN